VQAEYVVVDKAIQSLAAGPKKTGESSRDNGSPQHRHEEEFDIQSASDWPGIRQERVLLPPPECRRLWRQFSSDSAFVIQQAQATQVPPPPPSSLLHLTTTTYHTILSLVSNELCSPTSITSGRPSVYRSTTYFQANLWDPTYANALFIRGRWCRCYRRRWRP
jgi:hypothetical protein